MRDVLALLLVVASALACAREAQPPNLILISIDTLRADRLGCYGYARPTSPFLDREARRGVLFSDVTASSSWTYPSHASMFTGLYPSRNGATELKQRLRPDALSLAEILAARGYRAAGVVSSTLFLGYGLERGFEKLQYVDPGGPEPSKVSATAIEWLTHVERTRPFFYLVHYLDPHSDYSSLPEYEREFVRPYDGKASGKSEQLFQALSGFLKFEADDARHLSDLYDAGVRQQDAELQKLFTFLDGSGLRANTWIVLTSDHGEEFLEHGGVMHGLTQYEESVRVPLIVWGPSIASGARVETPVSLVDLLPTALDVLGVPTPAGLDGVSLRPSWESGVTPLRALFIEADMDPPGPTATTMVPGDDLAARWGKFKLLLDPAHGVARLYDIENDPAEAHDVSSEYHELVADLRAELEHFRTLRATRGQAEALSETDLKRLQDLGYAGKEE